MFFRILINFIIGYVRIAVEGYYIERFINICKNEKIAVWNLKRNNDIKLYLNVGLRDYRKIIKVAKKTKCKVKIERKRGVPFVFNRYKKRKIFGIFLMLLIATTIFSSNFIWNIEVRVENDEKMENIVQDLEEMGLKTGEWKDKINTKEVINRVRLKRQDIAWMGIELKGTNAIVRIAKAKEKPQIIDENEYCNIVSDKTGVITKISAQNGTAVAKVGDTITKGTPLINGWLEGKYTGIRYVHAKGEIEAKVWYTKSKKVEYNQIIKEETGNEENKYTIKLNNFQINLQKKLSKFKIYDTITSENKFKIFSDFYLPIAIEKTTYKEQKEKKITYTPEEAKNIGIEQVQKELDEEIENKENIVNKNINFYQRQDAVEVYVTYEVLENIGTEEKIVF
ncbi:MAG: sporulation protein YqfD [Clostridia bacterium]|nr:sporulation protein YqfD [Clostridia bacterium]